MSPVELMRLAMSTLRSHRLRSVLTTLGIMIGVMTVIGMLALIDGLNNRVASQLAAIGSNTLYVQKRPWVLSRRERVEVRKRPNLIVEDAEVIEERAELARWVAPLLTAVVTVRFGGGELDGVELYGTTPEYQFIAALELEAGRQMTAVDMRQSRRVAMIGATVAEELFAQRDPLGASILIGPHYFEVIAVMEEKGALFGNDFDNMIIIPFTTYTKLYAGPITRRGNETITIVVQPRSAEEVGQLTDQVTALLRRRRNLGPNEPNNFNINTAEQLMNTYRAITSGIYALMIGVTALSLIVGGIGIMNIMLVSVSERIREIGIRKAVGAKGADIRNQFLVEAITLSCAGGLIGTALGFLVAWGVSYFVNLPAAASWWSILLGFSFSVLVGVFFGWYPSRRAAAMNPIEALRHE